MISKILENPEHEDYPWVRKLVNEAIAFVLGVLHSYSHSVKCNLKYNPKYIKKVGMTDAEAHERVFSFLKPFIPSLRQMGYAMRLRFVANMYFVIPSSFSCLIVTLFEKHGFFLSFS